MNQYLSYAAAAVIGYLLGSVSTGLIVAGQSRHVDLRKEGSKSTGATNVLRVLGKKPAAITFFGDFLKVALAVILGSLLDNGTFLSGQTGAMIGGLAGIIGHNWPIYYQFKGGKGVASSVAVMLLIFPIPGAIAVAAFFLTLTIWKYVSLGSMVMLLLFAVLVVAQHTNNWLVCLWAVLVAGLCIFRHRANIGRLLKGTENKITARKK